jgi:phospholipid/cholesterol/gamma-HCH transport system permease protein
MSSLGKYFIFIFHLFKNRESFGTYFKLTLNEAVNIGWNSLVLIAIVSTFMGAVSTLQTAYNLVSPLIASYIVSLVVRDLTIMELAPTIIGIVYAGKVGSNIASELGTMRITEQIDALEVMGINAGSYLVLPKIVASIIMFPVLVVIAAFLAIGGGYLAATITGVVTGADYIYGIRSDFNEYMVTFMMIKALIFAFLVASIAAYKGFYTRGGALEVGRASTQAVTSSCIAILLADYLLAQLLL